MSKKCARCEKTVYPTEELKCLDKIWHKPCFKCKECGMALNMRNYKGFNKEPYCEAHIPKAKATTIAETLEQKRIAENTKIQSNVKYHADFEKSKGKFTQLADDPEILRIRQNTKIISNVAYHGELERKAEMEQKRHLKENGYNGGALKKTPTTTITNNNSNSTNAVVGPPTTVNNSANSGGHLHHRQNSAEAPVVGVAHTNKLSASAHNHHDNYNHYQQPIKSHTTTNINNNNAVAQQKMPPPPNSAYQSYPSRNSSQTLIYSSDRGGRVVDNASMAQRHIGSVHDMDPVNHNYGSLTRVYRAMYDYSAQDVDEVSFVGGDLIVNVSYIEGGWMTGEVQRTGKVGMLPANYVQLVSI